MTANRYVESIVEEDGDVRLKRFSADGGECSSWLVQTLDSASDLWIHYFGTTDETEARKMYSAMSRIIND